MRRGFVVAGCAAIAVAAAAACSDFDGDDARPAADSGADADLLPSEAGAFDEDGGEDILGGGGIDPDPDAGSPALDSGTCTNVEPFRGFKSLGSSVNSANTDRNPHLTADELTLYIGRATTGTGAVAYPVRFTRPARDQPWSKPVAVFGTNLPRLTMWTTPDGRRVYYDGLAGTPPNQAYRIYRRDYDIDAGKLGPEIQLAGLYVGLTSSVEPYLSQDESEIWFSSSRNSGQYDLFHATLDGSVAVSTDTVANTGAGERDAVVSTDRLTIYYASESGRATAKSTGIKMMKRATVGEPFTDETDAPGLEALADDTKGFSASPGWISSDNCRLYLHTTRDGTPDVYIAWRR